MRTGLYTGQSGFYRKPEKQKSKLYLKKGNKKV